MSLKIKIEDKDYLLKYTFNSFRHMENVDLVGIGVKDMSNPFVNYNLLSGLFCGALNWSSEILYTIDESDELLEKYISEVGEEEVLVKFLPSLMERLSESIFFKNAVKSAQKELEPQKKKTTKK